MRNDALDRFCLDGNKLRLFSGTYGAAGSEYRTEVETFARIRAYGTAGNGPAYFVVERKDGRIDEYGNSATSRIESLGQSTARAWALSKTRDRAGNEMTLNYIEDTTNGSYRIDSVTYGGNPGQGVAAAYEIKFNYQTKPSSEIDSGYIAGSLVKEITRLASVVVSQDATAVRSYTLTYEGALSSTSRSRLASVQECAGADCLAPTLFTYQNGSSGLNAELGTSAAVPTAGYAWPLDVNGDGREDLVYSSSTTSGGGTWMVMFANASGGYDTPFSTGIVNTNFTGAIAIDYDANGRGDLLVPYSGGTWWVLLGSPSGLAAPVNTGAPATTTGTGTNARALDLDGDGLQDLLWADLVGYAGGDAIRYRLRLASGGFSGTVQTLVGPLPVDEVISSGLFNSWANRMPSRAPDFNGDGRADLVYRHTLRFSNTLAPPEQTETDADAESNAEADSQAEAAGYNYVYTIMVVCQGGSTFGSWSADAASAPYFGDFNGDGKSDILYYDSSGTLRYRFSRGTSFASEANAGSILPYGAGWVVLDWDGDGYDDVLLPHTASGTWHLMRSTGETLAPAVSTGLSSAGSTVTSVTDHNGDGLHDLAYSSGGTWRYRSHAGPWPDLLLGATDGFGNALNFTYASLSNYVYYTRESTATYPTQEYQGPLYVVANVNASNGIGGTFNLQSFYYQGARIDLQGRGFLGFAYRSWIDSRDGTAARRSYRQDFPFIGAITNARRTQEPSGTVVTEEDTIYASHPYGSGWETRRLPYVSRTTRRDREAGGPYNGALLRTVVTDNLVDANTGTRYDSTRTTTEGATANGQHGGGIWTERVYHPTLFTDTAGGNWCVGRPASTQETRSHTMTGGTQQTRQVDTTWNGTYCRPTQTVLQPGDPQWQVTKALGYDGFGNLNSESVTGVGMAVRTTGISWGTTGRFPLTVTNALGQATTLGWNTALGVLTSRTDPNSIATTWQYDGFGRLTRENRPDGTASATDWYACDASNGYCGDPLLRGYALTLDLTNSGTEVRRNYTFFDAQDRLKYDERTGFSGSLIIARREYDALGRMRLESMPYLDGNPSYSTTYSFDLHSRPTQISRPVSDADPSLQTTTFAYEGLTTRITDANGKQTLHVADAQGQVARSVDHDGYAQAFDYDAFGNPVKVDDSLSHTLQTAAYNLRGLRTASFNVNLGSWSYGYNALGERTSHTDANGKTTSYTYDVLGRPLTRVMPEGTGSITSAWTWGTSAAAREIGRLKQAQISGTGVTTYREVFSFDSLGRPSQTQYVEGANNYYVNLGYSATTGLLDTLTYPTSTSSYRLKLQYEYQNGWLARIKDYNAPATVFWTANERDARGNAIDVSLGNGLRAIVGIDPVTGWVDYLQSGPGGGSTVQNLSYQWDKAGNLLQRQDGNQSLSEAFVYDNLYRLDAATLNGVQNLDVSYDALGNVSSKSGLGSYAYSPTRLHAVTQITLSGGGTQTFAYDANGNMTSRNGTELLWFANNLPKRIRKTPGSASNSSEFQYTAAGERWRHKYNAAGAIFTHVSLGGLVEKVTNGSVTDWRHLIQAEGRTVALYSRKSSGTNTLRYLLHDHLGSVDAITTSGGTVELKESFEAFGGRRGSAWSGVPSSAQLATMREVTRRGYTGHEHLDSTALIHLNGRVYDPALGRFVSADPGIDGALSTQGWNAYAYVKNNPLSFTDPTGFSRSPPTTRVLPIDPHSGVESITVEASRLYDNPIGPMFGFGGGGLQGSEGRSSEMEEIVVTGRRGRPPVPSEPLEPRKPPESSESPQQGNQNPCPRSTPTGRYATADGVDDRFDPPTVSMLSRALANLNRQGITPVITSGYRSTDLQAALGKSNSPYVITPARVSWHEVGAAVDFGPNSNGASFNAIVGAMTHVGFVWGGDFRTPDLPHFQSQPAGTSPSAAQVKSCATGGY